MRSIVMVYPKTTLDKVGSSVGLPLSIMHTTALIPEKRFRIKVIDQRIEKNWESILQDELFKGDVLCVAVSAMTGSQIAWALKTAEVVRRISPQIPIVWGGVHPSLYPRQTIMDPLVDIVVVNEADFTFPELIDALDTGKPLDQIKGLCFKDKQGKVTITPEREFAKIEDIPLPRYNLISDLKPYFLNLYSTKNALSLVAGKGCPHRCGFCYNILFNKQKWRALSASEIVKRVKVLISMGAESIDIIDDNFFTSMTRAKELADLLRQENIKINMVSNCRADYIARWSMDYLKMLYDAGFKEFFVGIESGNDEMLKHMKKDLTVEQVIIANRKLREVGIRPIYSFIAGFPGETVEQIQDTINLMVQLLEENPNISMTSLKVYTPFPGSPMYDECVQMGMPIPQTLAEWSNYHYNSATYTSWRPKEMANLIEKLSYLTYFLDQKTMSHHLAGNNNVLAKLIKIYSKMVFWRAKKHFYAFTPEVFLMKQLRAYIE